MCFGTLLILKARIDKHIHVHLGMRPNPPEVWWSSPPKMSAPGRKMKSWKSHRFVEWSLDLENVWVCLFPDKAVKFTSHFFIG